jgi:hypothetical protein
MIGRVMSLQELAQSVCGAPEPEAPALPLMEAQWHELEIIIKATDVSHRFEQGDRVQYKHIVGSLKNEVRGKLAMVFWRNLDFASPVDQAHLAGMDAQDLVICPDPDCLVLMISQGIAGFRVSQISFLEPAQGT